MLTAHTKTVLQGEIKIEKKDVKSKASVIVYITDCNLATISHMAHLKSRKVGEYNRQIAIAQLAIDWIRQLNIAPQDTRCVDVMFNHNNSVQSWADDRDIKKRKN